MGTKTKEQTRDSIDPQQPDEDYLIMSEKEIQEQISKAEQEIIRAEQENKQKIELLNKSHQEKLKDLEKRKKDDQEKREKIENSNKGLQAKLKELEQIKKDLEVARRNESDTGPIYKDKQNCEKEISQLRNKILELSKGPAGDTEYGKNFEDKRKKLHKAKLLSRQGAVNIRPSLEESKHKND